jgi:hypothetical protein
MSGEFICCEQNTCALLSAPPKYLLHPHLSPGACVVPGFLQSTWSAAHTLAGGYTFRVQIEHGASGFVRALHIFFSSSVTASPQLMEWHSG